MYLGVFIRKKDKQNKKKTVNPLIISVNSHRIFLPVYVSQCTHQRVVINCILLFIEKNIRINSFSISFNVIRFNVIVQLLLSRLSKRLYPKSGALGGNFVEASRKWSVFSYRKSTIEKYKLSVFHNEVMDTRKITFPKLIHTPQSLFLIVNLKKIRKKLV